VSRHARLVPVAVFPHRHEAEIVRGLLDHEGIPAVIRSDDAGGLYPDIPGFGGIAILVREGEAEAAREVLVQAEEENSGASGPVEAPLADPREVVRASGRSTDAGRSWLGPLVAAVLVVLIVVMALRELPVG
jgi:hypothetical protein